MQVYFIILQKHKDCVHTDRDNKVPVQVPYQPWPWGYHAYPGLWQQETVPAHHVW